jgi:hypothetical protein
MNTPRRLSNFSDLEKGSMPVIARARVVPVPRDASTPLAPFCMILKASTSGISPATLIRTGAPFCSSKVAKEETHVNATLPGPDVPTVISVVLAGPVPGAAAAPLAKNTKGSAAINKRTASLLFIYPPKMKYLI